MKCIDQLSREDLAGKRVLLRAGLDLPLNDKGEVSDIFRLKQTCATIEFLKKNGARTIVISKIGRDPKASTAPVARAMQAYFPVLFVPTLSGATVTEAIAAMKDGEIMLLENLQQDPREIAGDDGFAQELASYADMYVNDAFPSIHRASTTMVNITKFLPSYAGLLVREEIAQLSVARAPEHPSIALLGGAKFDTKAPLIRMLLESYDHLFITGALANDVFKARGLPVGRSLISRELPDASILEHPRFLAPIDVTTETPDGQSRVKKPHEVQDDDKIVDIGPDTVAMLAPHLTDARFILWSGPTGMYENGYIQYTQGIAELIARSGAKKVIGGGDTIAAIEKTGVPNDGLGFLSTGGGAMLEYLLKGTLPGIAALE